MNEYECILKLCIPRNVLLHIRHQAHETQRVEDAWFSSGVIIECPPCDRVAKVRRIKALQKEVFKNCHTLVIHINVVALPGNCTVLPPLTLPYGYRYR